MIDLGILWVFTAIFWLLASRRAPARIVERYGACSEQSLCTEIGDRFVTGWPMALLLVVWVAYLVGVFVLERGLTGRTVGTMLTGLVVVGADGRPLGPGRAALRSAAGVVDYLPCCLPVVGVTTMVASAGHRRVGDMAAESFVVTADRFGRPVELPDPHPAPGPDPAPAVQLPDRPPTASAGGPPIAPAPPAPPAGAATATPTTAPSSAGGPFWDAQRGAYLQWDPTGGRWLQFDPELDAWMAWDDDAGRWSPARP